MHPGRVVVVGRWRSGLGEGGGYVNTKAYDSAMVVFLPFLWRNTKLFVEKTP